MRAARLVASTTYDIRSTQILEDLNWIPIDVGLKKKETIVTFKALTGQAPGYLKDLFTQCLRSNKWSERSPFSSQVAGSILSENIF